MFNSLEQFKFQRWFYFSQNLKSKEETKKLSIKFLKHASLENEQLYNLKKKKLNGTEVLSFDILPDSVIDSLCPAQVPIWARTDTIMADK